MKKYLKQAVPLFLMLITMVCTMFDPDVMATLMSLPIYYIVLAVITIAAVLITYDTGKKGK